MKDNRREVWFARWNEQLYVGLNIPDRDIHLIKEMPSVEAAMKPLRAKNIDIVSVGICPPEYLGLE